MPKYYQCSDEYECSTLRLNKNKKIQSASFFWKSEFGFHPIRLFDVWLYINKQMIPGLLLLCLYLKHGVCLLCSSWTDCWDGFSWWGHQRCSRLMMTHGLTCCPELARVSKGIKSTHTKSVGFISTTTALNTRQKKKRNQLTICPRSEPLLFASDACNFQLW